MAGAAARLGPTGDRDRTSPADRTKARTAGMMGSSGRRGRGGSSVSGRGKGRGRGRGVLDKDRDRAEAPGSGTTSGIIGIGTKSGGRSKVRVKGGTTKDTATAIGTTTTAGIATVVAHLGEGRATRMPARASNGTDRGGEMTAAAAR